MATSDPQLNAFIEAQVERRKFQELSMSLTSKCWDTCMTSTPSTRLDASTQRCVVSCVERFIDTTNLLTQKLSRTAALNRPKTDSFY